MCSAFGLIDAPKHSYCCVRVNYYWYSVRTRYLWYDLVCPTSTRPAVRIHSSLTIPRFELEINPPPPRHVPLSSPIMFSSNQPHHPHSRAPLSVYGIFHLVPGLRLHVLKVYAHPPPRRPNPCQRTTSLMVRSLRI